MAIEKNTSKVARFDPEYQSLHSRDKFISSDDEDFQRPNSIAAVELDDDDDDEFDDCDSGAGSDDFDLLELGDSGEEFCQIGDQTCSIPYELYDLPGLKEVLSMEVWNDCLTEEERFDLARYLPDMDQDDFVLTLKELFTGGNLHFGSPLDKLFGMLKGGLCEPRVALYRQGWNFFQRRQHYHNLRKHHNSMISNLCQTRDAWMNCRGYSIDEKLRVLNIMKSRKSLMNENMEELRGESSDREESGNDMWDAKANGGNLGQNIGRFSGYSTGPTLDTSSRVRKTTTAPAKHGKQNFRGNVKLAGQKTTLPKELVDIIPPTHQRIEMKSGGRFGSGISGNKGAGNNYTAAVRMTEQMIEEDDEENIYEVAVRRDRNSPQVGAINKPGASKFWKKHEGTRAEEDVDSFTGVPISTRNDLHALGRHKAVSQLSDIKVLTAKPSPGRNIYDGGKKAYYTENLQQLRAENLMKSGKGQKSSSSLKRSEAALLVGSGPAGMSQQHDGLFPPELSYKPSHLNTKNKKWKMGKEAMELSENRKFTHAEYGSKSLKDKTEASSLQSGKGTVGNAIRTFTKCEETESESSEQMDENEDDNPLMRSKWAYPDTMPDLRYGPHAKKAKLSERDKKIEGFSVDLEMMKAEQKGKMHDLGYSNILPTKGLNKNYFTEYKLQDDLFWTRPLAADNETPFRLGRKDQMMDLSSGHHHPESSDLPLEGCNKILKKRKIKHDVSDNNDYLPTDAQLQLDNTGSLRKHGKNKLEDVSGAVQKGSEPPIMEMEMGDVMAETKPQKKPFPLITPTVLSGFSFSIIHLLSAVRMAMTTLLPEDSTEARKHLDKNDAGQGVEEEQYGKQKDIVVNSSSNMDINTSTPCDEAKVPSLTVQEIVNRVRSNPGDPCILETKEPLQDLVRSVLKIFASRTAPLGAKGWKPLVIYDKSLKLWSWMGPVSHDLSDSEAVEEVTSPDSWGLPHRMLVKLVDLFANWLKNSQDALQQIGSLPSPPLKLVQINLDEKERFKDLRAQKSLSTISPSSEEVKAYFRKEESLRYLIPDRAFSYTAVDGKKSIVAPLRRGGGKPTSKARDHFMLKRSRPPHVTILCLVRDAAARLPGSIGTRADVCTLIRDSQYIVEDVSDAQVNQVVSGALDRLHYERDPCVQFDGERKLWVYLHREREEEDFEDDGTSSTKKWRRQKKEATEPSEQGDDTVAYSEPVEQLGFDLVSDLNVEASYGDNDHKKSAPDYHNNGNDEVEDNAETSHGSDPGVPNVPVWNNLGLNNIEEHKLLGEENSTNEDIDDETFCGEPPA